MDLQLTASYRSQQITEPVVVADGGMNSAALGHVLGGQEPCLLRDGFVSLTSMPPPLS